MSRIFGRVVRTRRLVAVVSVALAFGSAVVVSYPEEALAQSPASDEPMKVLVGTLSGAKTTSARSWIVEGLNADSRFEVVGSADGAELKTGASESSIAEAALGLNADAVILGTSRFGKGWNAELHIYDGKDGHLIEKVAVKGPGFDALEGNLRAGTDYFPVIEKAEGFPPPPPPEPEVEEEADEAVAVDLDDEEEKKKPTGGRPSPFDATVGIRLYGRAFRYTDTLEQLAPGTFDPLIDYNLDAAPMPLMNLHWYPGAHFTDGVAAHIGLTGGYEMGIATKVRYTDDAGEESTFAQSHSLWYAGLRGRIPISPATLGLGANFGNHSFALKDSADGSPSGLFPNVSYTFLELGGDVEFQIGKLLLGAQGGYLLVLGVGEVGTDEWFPNAKANGVHFGGHVGFAASKAVHLLAGVDARAYGLNFNPVDVDRPDDRVAGGATDRYMSAWIGVRFRIPEKDGPAGGADAGSDSGDSEGGGGFDDFD